MSETTYKIREKANPEHVIACNWQNAFELVNHGFWEWVGAPHKQFARAQREARTGNPEPAGFEHLGTVDNDDTDDDDDFAPAPRAPAPAPKPTVKQIADTPVVTDDDGLEDMSRDELFAEAAKLGLTIDKRTGSKNLINAIRAEKGSE
jgi:hypothetical protein